MAEETDYYKILGVDKNVSADDLKKAYRKFAMKYHPDRNPGDKKAEEMFKKGSEAYEVLSDPDKRARYDQYGADGVKFGAGGFDFNRDFSHGADFSDILSQMFGGGGGGASFFGDLFGGRRRRADPNAPQRGANLGYSLTIDFEEALFGTTKVIRVPNEIDCDTCHGSGCKEGTKRETCKHCGGSGQITRSQGFFQMSQPCPYCNGEGTVVKDPCPKCRGKGRIRQNSEISLRIPAGVETGTRMRVAGRGEGGTHGGPAGDLIVEIEVRASDLFERVNDDDLLVVVPISFDVAALGGDVEVPTPTGVTRVKISAGTQSGARMRITGRGCPILNGRGNGNLIIEVLVETPDHLSSKQKKALEDLRAANEERSYPQARRFRERAEQFAKTKEKLEKKA